MTTARQWISDITNSLKGYHLDLRLSNRFVLGLLRDKLRKYIRQDSDNRRLYRITSVWRQLSCVALCEADLSDCGLEGIGCRSLQKSRWVIPETYQTQYGNTLKILTVDGSREFKQTTLHEYKEILRRRHRDTRVLYFFLLDGRVYIPDAQIEEVMAWGLFKHPHEVTALLTENHCLKPLDEPFPCPDYLEDVVKQETRMELLKSFVQVPADEKSNLNENDRK